MNLPSNNSISIQTFILIVLTCCNSCNSKEDRINLPGKIAVFKDKGICEIYVNSDSSKINFKLEKNNQIRYRGLSWSNHENNFFGTELHSTNSQGTVRGNVIRIDCNGKIVDRLYEAELGEIANLAYPTHDDKLLLVKTYHIVMPHLHYKRLVGQQNVLIMDIQSKRIIKRINGLATGPRMETRESPWIYKKNAFVYSLLGETGFDIDSNGLGKSTFAKPGVYLYDLQGDKNEFIIPGGYYAIGSPVQPRFAFIKGNEIYTYDVDSRRTELVYKASSNEAVSRIHWTPDGGNIYFVSFIYHIKALDLFTSSDKMVNLKTGKTIPCKSIGRSFEAYSWK